MLVEVKEEESKALQEEVQEARTRMEEETARDIHFVLKLAIATRDSGVKALNLHDDIFYAYYRVIIKALKMVLTATRSGSQHK